MLVIVAVSWALLYDGAVTDTGTAPDVASARTPGAAVGQPAMDVPAGWQPEAKPVAHEIPSDDGLPTAPVPRTVRPVESMLAQLQGRIEDDLGQPVVSALVCLHPQGGRSPDSPADRITAADGSFSFPGLTPGNWSLKITAVGHVEVADDLRLASGMRTLRIVLPRSGTLAGLVIDADGKPAPGTAVLLKQRGRRLPGRPSTPTDSSGAFELEDLAPGTYTLATILSGAEVPSGLEPEEIQVRPLERTTVQLQLPARAQLYGVVRDADGPVAGASVLFGGAPVSATTRTDAEGRYAISVPVASQGPVLAVAKGDGMTPLVPVELREGESLRQDLDFEDRVLEGHVVDAANGDPIEGARVTFAHGSYSFQRPTDDTGRFFAEHMHEARWKIGAEARGYRTGKALTVEMGPEGAPPSLRFELERMPVREPEPGQDPANRR